MKLYNKAQQSLIKLIAGASLLASSSIATADLLTYQCSNCDATTFLSGSFLFATDTRQYDWSGVNVNYGNQGTTLNPDIWRSTQEFERLTQWGKEYFYPGSTIDRGITVIRVTSGVAPGTIFTTFEDKNFNTNTLLATGMNEWKAVLVPPPSAVPIPTLAPTVGLTLLGLMGFRRRKG